MSSTLIISIIASIVVISLIASGISYSRQQTMKKQKLRIAKLRQQADELLGYTSLLLKIDKHYELLTSIQSLAVSALKSAHQLALGDQLILTNLRTQEAKLQDYKSCTRENAVTCYVSSDIELNQALSQIGQISKLLDIYRNKGSLPAATCQALQTHLQDLKVQLNMNSHLYQADCFAEVGDMTMYQMHIKQALDTLKKNGTDTDSKNAKIRELSTLLAEAKRTNRVVGDKNLIKPMKRNSTPEAQSAPENTNNVAEN